MKQLKVLLAVLLLAGSISMDSAVTNPEKTEYHKGWDQGHCEGWKEVKGRFAHCPYPPYPPYPQYPKTTNSFKDGYTDGLLRGMRDARK